MLGAEGFAVDEAEPRRTTLAEGLVIRTDPAGGDAGRARTPWSRSSSRAGRNQVAIPAERDQRHGRRRDRSCSSRASTGSRSSPSQQQVDAGIAAGHRDRAPTRRPTRWSTAGSTVTLIVSSGPGQVTRAAGRRVHRGRRPATSSPTNGLDASTSRTSDAASRATPTTARVLEPEHRAGQQVDQRHRRSTLVVGHGAPCADHHDDDHDDDDHDHHRTTTDDHRDDDRRRPP